MRIKICGITNKSDAQICIDLGAHALGFIFYEQSPRYIMPEKAAEIIAALGPFTTKVGVFVNKVPDEINDIVAFCRLDMAQLHGDESPKELSNVSVPVIKGFRISENFDFASLTDYRNCYYLLDSFHENLYGGTGEIFDWYSIPVTIRNKIILAGGISADNITTIYREIRPAAVDISSSVERAPGVKDEHKLRHLFGRIRDLQNMD